MTINDRLKDVRLTLKLSQKTFSAALGVKQSYYSEVESGKRKVTSKMIDSLIVNFGVSSDWLITGQGDRNINKSDNYLTGFDDGKQGVMTIKSNSQREKTDRFFLKAVIDLQRTHPELMKFHYDLSDLSALLADAEEVYINYIDTILNFEPDSTSYDDYKAKLIRYLNNYLYYNKVITPTIEVLKDFVLFFKNLDANKVVVHKLDELKDVN